MTTTTTTLPKNSTRTVQIDRVDLTIRNIPTIENTHNNTTDPDEEDNEEGLLLSKTALIALISSLAIMLFLVILLLSLSICLKMYKKKEDAK